MKKKRDEEENPIMIFIDKFYQQPKFINDYR